VAIGSGGPFGAEGPIIATGGALGSLIGQLLKITADERKTLLAAGAAAGMAATFGSPVSAVLLAVELLLFEFRPRSLIPASFATAAATAVRFYFVGSGPMFAMPGITAPNGSALAVYVMIGAVVGLASVLVTRAVYALEDGFALLPIHWMWWPSLGGLAVGVIGYFFPHTLGVGYDNISRVLTGSVTQRTLILLCAFKLLSWAISLSSGTSGGTLAPLFTIGGALGGALGGGLVALFPALGVDLRIAALVGMAAMFAGASRALLTSVVFAFETTMQPFGLLPLLGGCTAAHLVSSLLMKYTIMTEKIARRGVAVPEEFAADFLSQVLVRDVASYNVASLRADSTLAEVRAWIEQGQPGSAHHGFPVVDGHSRLLGVVGVRELLDPKHAAFQRVGEVTQSRAAVVFEDDTVREASDRMVREGVGRLPVVTREDPHRLVAIISGSDVRRANRRRLEESSRAEQSLLW